MVIMYTMEQLH